jgi:alanyl-tRNA synthetase
VFQVLQSVVLQAKKLGKSVYVFSIDSEQGKVAHVNSVADDAKSRGLDGRTWANAVVEVLGGKVSACEYT